MIDFARRLALAVLACLALAACAGVSIPQPPGPTPAPVATPSPVCAPGQTYGCYAQPPGKGWVYVCPVYDLRTGGVSGTIEVPTEAACVKPVVLPPPVVGGETPVSAADCPPIDPGASVDPKVKPYGKKGHYVELYILNSPSTCYAIHGNPVNPNSCHFEGWPNAQRCERYLIKRFGDGVGECPVFNAKTAAWPPFACREDDPHGNSMSCDHFGSADNDKRDDPKTPEFEGSPAVCGQQRDPKGKPEAGFFAIVLGNGAVQACLPGRQVCGAWRDYIEPK